ncbi:CaiB/BaiF CoA transferase family protein, partial [Falsiroseomonas oryzae]|uniref:CaiB/BaiF CoA transferase family protein n=1 Tax=Falsiroseomonas oryzae TaxID=2766473 RepID=UPI0022EB68E1
MSWPEAEGPAPLAGIRVLDLTRVVSGPFATMLLADLGADVAKVEEPGRGDESRSYGPPFQGGESAYFLSINRNKRSLALDLKSEAGRAAALALAAQADVVVENFRPGALDRLGLGWEALQAVNPRLILCSITGFGREGPDAGRPGYDLIIQGEAGVMDITGVPDGPPTKVGTSIADLVTGLFASQAVLAALRRRDLQGGRGSRVEVAMLDALASLLTFNAGIYFATGRSPARRGNAHATIVPYETFEAADGWVNIGVANDKFWALFCGVAGCEGLRDDPRFARAPDRVAHRAELLPLLAPLIRAEPRRHWVAALGAAGVPCGEIRRVGE